MRQLLALALAATLLAGCGSDQDDYCDAVEEHQQDLTELIGSDEPDALLQALEVFRELEERAPDDIADEWTVLVDAIGGFDDAIQAAGADPATYDPQDPEISSAERESIEAASQRLAAPETREALRAVDQQVRDVCHTPLTM